MIIEIRGTGFGNKGAELMLVAIIDRLSQTLPDARLAVRPSVGPYPWRARLGLWQVFDARHAGKRGWLAERFFHGGYRKRYGLVAEDDIDVVLDASGFALGDQWKREWVEGAARQFEQWRHKGKKIILLPQAFGPFEDPDIRSASGRALSSADLVYARDPESFAAISKLVSNHSGLRRAPDFTNLVEGVFPDSLDIGERPACIIPNTQMLRHGSAALRNVYVPFMAGCALHLQSRGFRPFILLHEEKHDQKLAHEINECAGGRLKIMQESDARVIKGIIGQCFITVASRFHGLVSALSQGVPSLGTSWSHKYQYLFEDYGRPNWILDPVKDYENASKKVDELIDQLEVERDFLLSQDALLKEQAKIMWADVEAKLAL